MQPPIVDAGLDEPLLPRPQDLPALVDRPLGEHGVDRHAAVGPARLLDRAILDAVRHRRDMLDDRVRQVDALPPEMLEFLAHPFGRMRVVVAPEDFVGVPEGGGRVVDAADEGIDAPVGVLDHACLAVDEDVLVVARHHPHLHAAGGEQIMQAAITLAREQKIDAVLGRLPGRDQRSRQRLLAVARRLGDLHVEGVEVAVADDLDLVDRLQRLADDLQQRGPEIAGDAEVSLRAFEARREDRAKRLAPRRETLDRHAAAPGLAAFIRSTRSSFSASANSSAAALSSGRVVLVFSAT